MNIKTKLILGIGMLAGMIILLVTLSVVNLQILTATNRIALLLCPDWNVRYYGFPLPAASVS